MGAALSLGKLIFDAGRKDNTPVDQEVYNGCLSDAFGKIVGNLSQKNSNAFGLLPDPFRFPVNSLGRPPLLTNVLVLKPARFRLFIILSAFMANDLAASVYNRLASPLYGISELSDKQKAYAALLMMVVTHKSKIQANVPNGGPLHYFDFAQKDPAVEPLATKYKHGCIYPRPPRPQALLEDVDLRGVDAGAVQYFDGLISQV